MLAQKIRLEKQPAARVKDEFELQNAFVGLLYCSVCGKRIGRTTSSKARDSLPRLRCVNSRNCHNVSSDYDVVEKEIISALRTWLNGYRIKIDTFGYSKDIEELREQNKRYSAELQKLKTHITSSNRASTHWKSSKADSCSSMLRLRKCRIIFPKTRTQFFVWRAAMPLSQTLSRKLRRCSKAMMICQTKNGTIC